MLIDKIECWNCGIKYKAFVNYDCPNCKIDYFGSWVYSFDWKTWCKDMSIAFRKLSGAINYNHGRYKNKSE